MRRKIPLAEVSDAVNPPKITREPLPAGRRTIRLSGFLSCHPASDATRETGSVVEGEEARGLDIDELLAALEFDEEPQEETAEASRPRHKAAIRLCVAWLACRGDESLVGRMGAIAQL